MDNFRLIKPEINRFSDKLIDDLRGINNMTLIFTKATNIVAKFFQMGFLEVKGDFGSHIVYLIYLKKIR
jgi:hypothetical protein